MATPDFLTCTAEEANREVEALGRELADPARKRSLNDIIYELGLWHDRLIELGWEV